MDLTSVVPFVRVAEERHFRRAAARLGVTPAAVSKSIARLEAELGVTLFDRNSRRVELTPEGRLFYERCAQALAHLEAGRELVAGAHRLAQGPLRVSISPILARRVVGRLGTLAEAYPRMTFELSVTDRFADLVEERIDVAVRIGELEPSNLVSRLLARPRWVTVASPGYLARHPAPKTPAELSSHDWLVFRTPRGVMRHWTFRGHRAERSPAGARLISDDGETLVEAALAGLGVCQVFDFLVIEHLRAGRLVALLEDQATDAPPIRALWLRRRTTPAKVRVLVDFLERQLLVPRAR